MVNHHFSRPFGRIILHVPSILSKSEQHTTTKLMADSFEYLEIRVFGRDSVLLEFINVRSAAENTCILFFCIFLNEVDVKSWQVTTLLNHRFGTSRGLYSNHQFPFNINPLQRNVIS